MVTVTAVCLCLLVLFNIYVGNYTAAFVVICGVCIFRIVAFWHHESKIYSTNTVILQVGLQAQRDIKLKLAKTSPSIAINKRHLRIKFGGNPPLDTIINTPKLQTDNRKTCFILTHPWAPLGGDVSVLNSCFFHSPKFGSPSSINLGRWGVCFSVSFSSLIFLFLLS